MSSVMRLLDEVDVSILILIQHKSGWHTASPCQLSISLVQSCFQLSSGRSVKLIVFPVIVNHASLVGLLIPSFTFILHEIVAKKINAVLVFRHLVSVINIAYEIVLF